MDARTLEQRVQRAMQPDACLVEPSLFVLEYLKPKCGGSEEARRLHDRALELEPEEFEVRYQRGLFFEEIVADFSRALDEYAEATRLEPSHSQAHYKLGDMQIRTNQWPQAIATYTVLIKLEPGDARLYYTRARGYYLERKYQEAVLDLSQAIALKPDYRDAYGARAACYERLGMPDKQQADLRIFQSLPR